MNISCLILKNKKKSRLHADYKDYYNEETKNIVANIYKKEIVKFGYTF